METADSDSNIALKVFDYPFDVEVGDGFFAGTSIICSSSVVKTPYFFLKKDAVFIENTDEHTIFVVEKIINNFD